MFYLIDNIFTILIDELWGFDSVPSPSSDFCATGMLRPLIP